MDFMMQNILSIAAGAKQPRHDEHSAMDLTRKKSHTCERFVDQEDLRPESYLSGSELESICHDEESHRQLPPNGYIPRKQRSLVTSTPGKNNFDLQMSSEYYHFSSPSLYELSKPSFEHAQPVDLTETPAGHRTRVKQEIPSAEATECKLAHPVSIATLLGSDTPETSDHSPSVSKPAEISSTYMDLVSSSAYNAFCATSQVRQPRTRTPHQKDIFLSSGYTRSYAQSKVAYWCHVCNELCVDKTDAKKHQMIHLMKNDKCSLRRLLFHPHGHVTKHEYESCSLNRVKCGLCDKVVANCFFTKHQRLHDGHVCEVCDHEFSNNSRLQDHRNIHTKNTSFECTTCDRTFTKRSSLIQHQRYHREYKKFKCSFCQKCFNSKYASAVHERLHTGENPFTCNEPGCDRAFPQKIQLRLHENSHHTLSRFTIW